MLPTSITGGTGCVVGDLRQCPHAGLTRAVPKISTRATQRPELDKAVALAGELRASGVRVTLVVYEHKRLGSGIELATLAEELKASDVGPEFLTGELQGSHDPSGAVFTVLAALSGGLAPALRTLAHHGPLDGKRRRARPSDSLATNPRPVKGPGTPSARPKPLALLAPFLSKATAGHFIEHAGQRPRPATSTRL
ncbi:hypothetical protein [Streptomyces sp. NPDC058424]|uniref:hypothetical protein n=1 Tax=Streptomyces sp. NPDC058424 TaxID=3346491 RepID=UPI00364777A8